MREYAVICQLSPEFGCLLVASEYIFGNSGDIDYFWASD